MHMCLGLPEPELPMCHSHPSAPCMPVGHGVVFGGFGVGFELFLVGFGGSGGVWGGLGFPWVLYFGLKHSWDVGHG